MSSCIIRYQREILENTKTEEIISNNSNSPKISWYKLGENSKKISELIFIYKALFKCIRDANH